MDIPIEMENDKRYLDFARYKGNSIAPFMRVPQFPCFDLVEKPLTVTGIKTTRYIL